MDQEKYALTWHKYPDHLRGMMREMMTSGDFADVTLVCDDKKTLKAHRNILSACSTVFKDILQMHTQSNHPVIYLKGLQYSEIDSILQFMYLGEAKFYESRINEFIHAVKDLEIKELSKGYESSEPDERIEESEKHYNESKDNHTLDNNSTGYKEETVESNNGIKQTKFQCKQCDKTFSVAPGLWQHNKSEHEGVKYACNQCDYEATRHDHLTIHIQAQHEGVKYGCDQCEFQFTDPSSLRRHIQSKHKGVKVKYACELCNYQATDKYNLRKHIKSVHEGVKDHACNHCDYRATRPDHLTIHIQSKHEGVKYACNHCEYEGSKEALRHHLRKKHQYIEKLSHFPIHKQ